MTATTPPPLPVLPRVRRVVYMAVFGGYDVLGDPGPVPDGWTRVCFTDAQDHPAWHVVRMAPPLADLWRSCRAFKVLAHRLFPDAEYSLWMDANFTLRCDLHALTARYLADADLAAHPHPHRDCIYDEVFACIAAARDAAPTMCGQVLRYAVEGFPRHAGLIAGGVLLRRHSVSVRALNDLWWREIATGSRRDQLSFNYVAWRLGFGFRLFDSHLWNGPLFAHRPHGTIPADPDGPGRAGRPDQSRQDAGSSLQR